MPNSIKKLEEAFKEGKYDQLLKDIYVDEAVIEYQQERYIKALEDDKEAAKKAEETGVEYTEDAAGTSLGDLLANIKL